MPSPFPGMDPWLESPENFGDFHDRLIIYLSEEFNRASPPGYVARGAQFVWVDDRQRREPDVGLFGPNSHVRQDSEQDSHELDAYAGVLAIADIEAPSLWEQSFLEVYSSAGRRLVTMIEVLSPSNKQQVSQAHQAYLQKQKECLATGINLVELDFLRGGTHTTCVNQTILQQKATHYDYHIAILQAGSTPSTFAMPFRLQDKLPELPIPLDPGVKPVSVALQPILDRIYETGRYSQWIDYSKPPEPPLNPEQQAWATQYLSQMRANHA